MFQRLTCGGCYCDLMPHEVDYQDDFTGESFCDGCMRGGVAHSVVTKTPATVLLSTPTVPKRTVADIVFGVGGGSNLSPA
jgi:hypothetical protein